MRAGQLFPELDSVLFTLQVGELSEPVSSPMGWHLLQCLGVREAEPILPDEALPQIIEQQWSFAREQAYQAAGCALQRQSRSAGAGWELVSGFGVGDGLAGTAGM